MLRRPGGNGPEFRNPAAGWEKGQVDKNVQDAPAGHGSRYQQFPDAKMITALLERLTHHCRIQKTGNDSFRFRASTVAAPMTRKGKSPA